MGLGLPYVGLGLRECSHRPSPGGLSYGGGGGGGGGGEIVGVHSHCA